VKEIEAISVKRYRLNSGNKDVLLVFTGRLHGHGSVYWSKDVYVQQNNVYSRPRSSSPSPQKIGLV